MNVARPTPADRDEMLRVAQAADRAAYGDSDWTADVLTDYLGDVDPETDVWLFRLDGRLAAWASVEERRGGRAIADGYVRPDARGRGIGTRILGLTEERARQMGVTAIENATLDRDAATNAFYGQAGYEEARWFWRMVVRLGERPLPTVPVGLRIEQYDPATAGPVLEALNDSFAEEWGWTPIPADDFASRSENPSRFRDDLSFTAWAEGEVAGIVHGAWKGHGDWGWIGNVGVRKPWRGRGLGLALLHTAFARFWDLGERSVALGVDAHNPTGATHLYERAGMRRLWEAVLWRKEL